MKMAWMCIGVLEENLNRPKRRPVFGHQTFPKFRKHKKEGRPLSERPSICSSIIPACVYCRRIQSGWLNKQSTILNQSLRHFIRPTLQFPSSSLSPQSFTYRTDPNQHYLVDCLSVKPPLYFFFSFHPVGGGLIFLYKERFIHQFNSKRNLNQLFGLIYAPEAPRLRI